MGSQNCRQNALDFSSKKSVAKCASGAQFHGSVAPNILSDMMVSHNGITIRQDKPDLTLHEFEIKE